MTGEPRLDSQDRFFAAVASRNLVRPAVRAIVRSERGYLVQRPTDNERANYAFIGGEYEVNDSFETRIRREFEEETTAKVVRADYRFVVENRFMVRGKLIQTLEHYLEVELDTTEVASREPGLVQVWLCEASFAVADVRPLVVRDALLTPDWRAIRSLEVTI